MATDTSNRELSLGQVEGDAVTALVLAFHFPPIGGGGVQRMVRSSDMRSRLECD